MLHSTSFRFATVMLVALALVACAAPTPTPAPKPTATAVPQAEAAPTAASAATVAPTAAPSSKTAKANELVLATTTSTDDSGLLKVILPEFEKQFNIKVNVIAVGTGQSLKLGEDGNADVVLVHAREQEDAFMAAGHGLRREDVMYNDFVVLGPKDDPAGLAGSKTAAEALQKLAKAQAKFVSRGDNSGTHTKEKAVWKAVGVEPAGGWYISAGQGMGAVLTMANEQKAYTLSDRATYLSMAQKLPDLKIVSEGDPVLLNPYGVITVNPNKGTHIKADLATKFVDWIISVPTQEMIGKFGVDKFGAPLFTPHSAAWRKQQGK